LEASFGPVAVRDSEIKREANTKTSISIDIDKDLDIQIYHGLKN
jgi:hypothetical protein